MKLKYESSANTPDTPLFTVKDVKEILRISSHISVQRFDNEGLIKVKRNSQNFRIYSYNDIQVLAKIQKLMKLNVPLRTINTLMEFEKSKGRDPVKFIEEFAEFYKQRIYSANRNTVRKTKKQK